MNEQYTSLVLVNEKDEPIGENEKVAVHLEGQRHRAFSVCVVRPTKDGWSMLLQRRHPSKYHSGDLWANAACGHPGSSELVHEAAANRLQYEMGITLPLDYVGVFEYREHVSEEMIEHEIDHVYIGYGDVEPQPHPDEVTETRWLRISDLVHELGERPELFAPWLSKVLVLVQSYLARELV